jgi:GNAT superfamily N-acetyltransferase
MGPARLDAMIRECTEKDFEALYTIINDSARAYKGIIPADRWNEPYMSREYLRHELEAGVIFWGYETAGDIVGIMGIQDVHDVTLIRHAYVATAFRGQGIGGKLIAHIKTLATRPTLVGTWATAGWASVLRETRLSSGHDGRKNACSGNTVNSDRQTETSGAIDGRYSNLKRIVTTSQGRTAPVKEKGERQNCPAPLHFICCVQLSCFGVERADHVRGNLPDFHDFRTALQEGWDKLERVVSGVSIDDGIADVITCLAAEIELLQDIPALYQLFVKRLQALFGCVGRFYHIPCHNAPPLTSKTVFNPPVSDSFRT